MRILLLQITALVAVLGCSSSENKAEQASKVEGPEAPVVTDERKDLILSWFADGGSQVGSSVSEVPAEARGEVRVQDPNIPPEKRDPNWIFLADLTSPDSNGRYPVRAEKRSEYEAKRHTEEAQSQPPAPETVTGGVPQAPPLLSSSGVTMYATKHCPVCKKARRWLLEQKIPYVEKDVDEDANAARELSMKGQAQGVPTSGVPVFEIGGRLVPGFEPEIIRKLYDAMPKPTSMSI